MKRFTETSKWNTNPWFRKLPPRLKCLWQFLVDCCDAAGVIAPDWELMSFQIGEPVTADDLASLGHRVEILPNGKLYLTGFIAFQHGKLSQDCKPHGPVFKSLQANGITFSSLSKGYPYPLETLEGKGEGKDKVQDELEEGAGEKPRLTAVLPEVPSSGRKFADHTDLQSRIGSLRPEWARPVQWGASELHHLHAALGQFEELVESDWNMLKRFLAASLDQSAGYWQPNNRSKFVETFSDVFASATRWQSKRRPAATLKELEREKEGGNAPKPVPASFPPMVKIPQEELSESFTEFPRIGRKPTETLHLNLTATP
jgi:hypothetical protein